MNEVRHRAAEGRLWVSEGVHPIERRLTLTRLGLSVRVQEVGEGPAVLFVHGASNTGTSWAPLVARLEGFRCVMLDRPGCGLSEPLAAPLQTLAALEAFADALVVDVLDALELDRAHLVATSFGGFVALRTAAAHPDRIRRVVELGWTIGAGIPHTPFVMRVAAIPGVGRFMAALPPTKGAVRAMLRNIGLGQALDAGRISPEVLDWFQSVLRDTDTMANELRAMPPLIRPLKGFDEDLLLPAEVLASIDVPTFFLWGAEDPMGGAEVARPFVAQIPGAELELLPGAGHAVWLDDPDLVATRTQAFLDG